MWVMVASGLLIIVFIAAPLFNLVASLSPSSLLGALKDPQVTSALRLSFATAAAAALISLVLGTPFAYLLARRDFAGKRVVEGIVDIPVVIPHPVVGIAILSVVGRDFVFGRLLASAGIRVMGSATGIIVVMAFVGLPFYVNAVREAFEAIPVRLERVSRSLGAPAASTFFRISLPLARRGMLVGAIMCAARALSEFGAVVVVAYHPMVAPVLIYERFESYGLKYSQPVAVLLVSVSLGLFLALRLLMPRRRAS